MRRGAVAGVFSLYLILGSGVLSLGEPLPASASTPQACVDVHGQTEPPALDGVHQLSTPAHLVFLSTNQQIGDPRWRTRDFAMTSDIDLQGCLWTPIGRGTSLDDQGFDGTFDGGSFTISGLFADNTGMQTNAQVGFFGMVYTAGVIRNVTLDQATVTSTIHGSFGALVGDNWGVVESSHASGTVTATNSTALLAGGLIGVSRQGATVRDSSASVTVSSSGNSGGLVGLLGGTITASFATGSVTTATGGKTAGGLIGLMGDFATVENSFATGTVVGDKYVGGLAGGSGNGAVTNSFSTGQVTGNTDVGGLIGNSGNQAQVSGSFWDVTTSNQTTSAEGTGKTTAELQQLATFTAASWSIATCLASPSTAWGIQPGNYPFLVWSNPSGLAACPAPPPAPTPTRTTTTDPAEEEVAETPPTPAVVAAPRPTTDAVAPEPAVTEPVAPEEPTEQPVEDALPETTGEAVGNDVAQGDASDQTDLGWLWAVGIGGVVALGLAGSLVWWVGARRPGI